MCISRSKMLNIFIFSEYHKIITTRVCLVWKKSKRTYVTNDQFIRILNAMFIFGNFLFLFIERSGKKIKSIWCDARVTQRLILSSNQVLVCLVGVSNFKSVYYHLYSSWEWFDVFPAKKGGSFYFFKFVVTK